MIDNVVPYIGGEEDKLETEPRKLLSVLKKDEGEVRAGSARPQSERAVYPRPY